MPSLLGDKAAQWLRERMDSGDWKTVPRRINHTSQAGGGEGGCVLGVVTAYTYPTGAFRARIYTFRSGSGASTTEVTVICPNIGGLTRLAEGDVIIMHKCQMDEYEGEEAEGGET